MGKIEYYSRKEIDKIKKSANLVAKTLKYLSTFIEPGISTKELDKLAKNYILKNGGIPAFYKYNGFPANICISINNEVVHGIASTKRKLRNGDIVSLDVGVIMNGFYGDAAHTFAVGVVSDDVKKFLEVSEQSLYEGINKVAPGNYIGDIGNAVQTYAESYGYGVVRDYVGHGLGRNLHEAPSVPNYGKPKTGVKLEKGMVIAIEPMINIGTYKVETLEDDWTVVTRDKSLSCHFEHDVAVTEKGFEILSCE